ncbi:TonB-dependent receptor [Marinoscillum sp. MHG1-6]|uniref:SusC/RagA family TonB-linked outer membrane protein n=1 Tax=Marinoscillum sp. MHG1-6 TaxID=2959627 RepID=UPI00215809C3|nr:TonB-dependent receptor [Marinoscillum sp. MHG1-6]
MNFRKILCALCLLPALVYGQSRTIQGVVRDSDTGELLPGATIALKGTTEGTITDIEGQFRLDIDTDGVLVVSFVGYQFLEMNTAGRTSFDVLLNPDVMSLSEVVVVGYTAERKKDLTGAVAVVDLEEIEDLPAGNIMKNIQGRVPGVSITTDGSPGSGATVRIRGTGTLNNNDPLYVIDGVPTKAGMHEINPADIESVQVLKDAASASIYGSRSANGVIIITTKRGKDQGVKINLDANWSLQQYTTKMDPLNTAERGKVYWQAAVNAGLNPVSPIYDYTWNGDLNNPILGSVGTYEYLDAAQTMYPSDTRWFDEISQTSLLQSYNLNVSNGGKNGNVLFSLGYYDHDGIVKETNFERINVRVNSDYSFRDGLVTIGENFQISLQEETQINAGDILFTSLVQHPIVPVHTIDGGWGGPVSGMTDRQNPVRLIEDNKQNRYKYIRPFGNAYIALNPLKNLTFKTNFAVDYSLFYLRAIRKKYVSGFLSEPDNQVSSQSSLGGNWIWSNTATYDLELEKHRLNFLAGAEQIRYASEWYNASREGFISEDPNYAYLSSGSANQLNAGGGTQWALMSFFGKVNYAFNDRYLASFTLRRDGSSRFGRNNRYGNFPAASIGWRISEEPFLKNLVASDFDLKLRASWGQNGNQEIDPLAVYNIYRPVYGKEDAIWDNPNPPEYRPSLGTAYDIAGQDIGELPSGYIASQQANDDLKWETTTQVDFGVDFLFSKFSGSVDYFEKKTSDILYFRTLIAAVGEAGGQFVNGGTIKNSGIEAALTYEDEIGPVSFDITGNIATLKNEVVSMPEELFVRTPLSGAVPNDAKTELLGVNLIGRSVNSMYGYVTDGLFQNQEEVDAHVTQPGKGVGRIRYKDLNGDGVIDNNDQTFIGTSDPSLSYGLNLNANYKRFNFTVFVQGVSGIDYYNSYKTYTDFASLWPGTNWGSRTLDAWSPTNTGSDIPRLTAVDSNNEGRVSTYFIENASYLKLRNVQIGYTLGTPALERIGMRSLRVYIQGQNLLTFKNKEFTAPDPENPNYAFPIPAIYTTGISVGF